jgi:uncharacterized membrane protein
MACSKREAGTRGRNEKMEAWLAFLSTLTWFFGIAAFFFLHYILSVARIRSVIRMAVLCGVAALYIHIRLDTGKIERIHMLEYGILTYLALRALSLSMGSLLFLACIHLGKISRFHLPFFGEDRRTVSPPIK